MFGSLGVPELLLIFAVILIVFGPRRIPEIGRTLGKAMGEFRKATDDLKSTIEREVRLEELKTITPTSIESFTTPYEAVSRSEPEGESTSRQAVESTSLGVDESTSGLVDSSSSLPVDEPTSEAVGELEPALTSADSSTTRRLEDSKTPDPTT